MLLHAVKRHFKQTLLLVVGYTLSYHWKIQKVFFWIFTSHYYHSKILDFFHFLVSTYFEFFSGHCFTIVRFLCHYFTIVLSISLEQDLDFYMKRTDFYLWPILRFYVTYEMIQSMKVDKVVTINSTSTCAIIVI